MLVPCHSHSLHSLPSSQIKKEATTCLTITIVKEDSQVGPVEPPRELSDIPKCEVDPPSLAAFNPAQATAVVEWGVATCRIVKRAIRKNNYCRGHHSHRSAHGIFKNLFLLPPPNLPLRQFSHGGAPPSSLSPATQART